MADRYGDPHELVKSLAYSDYPRRPGHFPISRPDPRKPHGASDQYLVLDTAQCEENRPERGEFRFNIVPQRAAVGRTVGVRDTLKTVTEIQTFPFTVPLPLLVAAPTSYPTLTLAANAGATNPYADTDPVGGLSSQLAQGTRVTLYLTEAGEQCFHDFKGRRHLFEYEASLVGTVANPDARMLLTPVNDIFIFTQPITDMHGITMRFFTPDEELRLPPDEFRNVQLTTNGAGRIIINITDLRYNLTNIIKSGDRIFLDGAQVVASAGSTTRVRELNDFLSRPDGLCVGANITASTLDTDPSIVPAAFGANVSLPTLGSITLRVAKNRIRAPFRIRRIIEGVTNYIEPN